MLHRLFLIDILFVILRFSELYRLVTEYPEFPEYFFALIIIKILNKKGRNKMFFINFVNMDRSADMQGYKSLMG